MRIKQSFLFILGVLAGFAVAAQTGKKPADEQTLLWKVTGNGLTKPSYLYGTIHILCKDDALLSTRTKQIIKDVDLIYFEADLDDMTEMQNALKRMQMTKGITLKSLLSAGDYEKVKDYFAKSGQGMVFSALENFKPMILSTMMQMKALGCENTIAVEQVIMNEATKYQKEIRGLETMAYQASLFDSIPYDVQAKQLLDVVNQVYDVDGEIAVLINAYKKQDLKAIATITEDKKWGVDKYLNLLVYNRNRNWVTKLNKIMPENPVLIAVGAGHLPGKYGIIDLLKAEGYHVIPLKNTNSF